MAANSAAKSTAISSSQETPEQEAARLKRQHAEMDAIMGTGIDNAARHFDDDALGSIDSFKAAMEAVGSVADVESFDDYGNGFSVLDTKHKNQLVGTPFVIVEWRFNEGKMGGFVSFTAVTKDNRRLVINDGSTGIYKQLQTVTTKRMEKGHASPQTGLLVEKGLRVSEYTYIDRETKQETPAATYYLG